MQLSHASTYMLYVNNSPNPSHITHPIPYKQVHYTMWDQLSICTVSQHSRYVKLPCASVELTHKLASNPGFPFRYLSCSFGGKIQSCKTKSGTESLGLRLLLNTKQSSLQLLRICGNPKETCINACQYHTTHVLANYSNTY